jgi:putative transposon-encoded protein
MPRTVEITRKNRLVLENITGYIERQVVPHGTGAKVTCPKEFIGKTAYLVLTDKPWEGKPIRRRSPE